MPGAPASRLMPHIFWFRPRSGSQRRRRCLTKPRVGLRFFAAQPWGMTPIASILKGLSAFDTYTQPFRVGWITRSYPGQAAKYAANPGLCHSALSEQIRRPAPPQDSVWDGFIKAESRSDEVVGLGRCRFFGSSCAVGSYINEALFYLKSILLPVSLFMQQLLQVNRLSVDNNI
jgi:hypothetical protein